ncbi:MAG: type II secretion system protein [Patescibacteria group bacterium]
MPANTKQSGYTIPELIVSITLLGIISVSILAIFMNYFVVITRNNTIVDMTTDAQNLLRSTVEELRYGAGVRQTNSISDANGPGGGWNTSNSDFVIIIAMPATDASGNYIIDSLTGSPYNNEFVYFKSGTILYKRTLANTGAVGNSEKTSCPSASASTTCPADTKLIENVSNMIFTLYDQDDISTANALLARSVKIDLTMQRDTFGDPLVLNNNIRVTLRNTF